MRVWFDLSIQGKAVFTLTSSLSVSQRQPWLTATASTKFVDYAILFSRIVFITLTKFAKFEELNHLKHTPSLGSPPFICIHERRVSHSFYCTIVSTLATTYYMKNKGWLTFCAALGWHWMVVLPAVRWLKQRPTTNEISSFMLNLVLCSIVRGKQSRAWLVCRQRR